MARRFVVPGVLLAATALIATACSPVSSAQSDDTTPASAARSASPSPSGGSSASPSVTPSATPTSDLLDLGDKTFKPGAKGKKVKALQRRLRDLDYDPGNIDGSYGASTIVAVWAFQKVNGIKPTGTIGKKTRAAFDDPKLPKVRVADGAADRVEVDLKKQILVVYENDQIELISHVSSGSGIPYCEKYKDEVTGKEGTNCGDAVTPTGDYKASRRIPGWRKSPLGMLWNPVYFNGGIAFHGAPSVPLYPASHGCVRVPMHTANLLPDLVDHNERVYVRR